MTAEEVYDKFQSEGPEENEKASEINPKTKESLKELCLLPPEYFFDTLAYNANLT